MVTIHVGSVPVRHRHVARRVGVSGEEHGSGYERVVSAEIAQRTVAVQMSNFAQQQNADTRPVSPLVMCGLIVRIGLSNVRP